MYMVLMVSLDVKQQLNFIRVVALSSGVPLYSQVFIVTEVTLVPTLCMLSGKPVCVCTSTCNHGLINSWIVSLSSLGVLAADLWLIAAGAE